MAYWLELPNPTYTAHEPYIMMMARVMRAIGMLALIVGTDWLAGWMMHHIGADRTMMVILVLYVMSLRRYL
jgi:hypothetical protein